MSQSPNDEQSATTPDWLHARRDLSVMIKQGRSFSGHERNCCFLNTTGERFATVSAVSGLDFPDDGRCVAVVDWDHDGDLDVWLANRNAPRLRFMRNDTATDNHFVTLRLIGNGTTTNRDAIGARVEVVSHSRESKRAIRTLRAGEGFLSQSSKWLHFGLGDARQVEKVVVRWPGGGVEEYTGLQVDRRYRLQQDAGRPEHLASRPRPRLLPASIQDRPSSRVARVPLVARFHIPRLSYKTFDGVTRSLGVGSGHPVLVNLWASWCAPCVAELAEFARREDELRGAGIEVVAVSVDGLDDGESDVDQAQAILARLGFPFPAGMAERDLLEDLQRYHDYVVSMWRPLPIPTSFLIDGQSRLAVIYKGPVTVDEVLADARQVPGEYVQRFERAACLPGRALGFAQVAASARHAETRTRYQVAAGLEAAGRLDEAATGYVDLLNFHPECEEAHVQLAVIYLRQEEFDKAAMHCRRALEFDPDNPRHHNTMGNILSGQQKLTQAESHYARAIQIDANYLEAHNNLGTVYASQGKLDKAGLHFKRAIAIDPNSAEAHNNLGSVFAFQGDISAALVHYKEAIRADPEYAEAYNNLGSMYARSGDLKRAVEQYQLALEINPDYGEARDNLNRAQSALRALDSR